MEEDDKGCPMIRLGVSGWVFRLVPAYPGCPGQKLLNGCVCVCVNICESYKQERGCLMHFLNLLAVWWPCAESARDKHDAACNFTKCFHRQT